MSFPNIPNITPLISITTEQTVPLLLSSIALEELALAHIMNAEAEKLQFVLGTLDTEVTFTPAEVSLENLLAVDSSVQRTLRDVIKKEMLLEFKFENVLDLLATCLQYTALGDSIAAGVGATNNFGYVNYFQQFLRTQHAGCVNLTNRAVPGFTSSDLLQQLRQDATTRLAVKNADIITISIGGGNLFDCLNSPNPPGCLSIAVATFANDWPQILNEIRNSIGSKAQILVMTVYNPFRGDDNPNFGFADFFIQSMNNVINNPSFRSTFNYKVADVYSDFQGQFPDGTWKVCVWTHFCENLDPHPTDSGHQEIARLHELIFSN